MKKATILIVDADEISAMLLEEVIQMMYQETAGIRILKTNNGADAIHFCHKYQINLILTEVHLPKMDGWELTKKIKALCPSIPIIIQTALITDDTQQMFSKSDADGFMAKPIDIIKMQKEIRNVL